MYLCIASVPLVSLLHAHNFKKIKLWINFGTWQCPVHLWKAETITYNLFFFVFGVSQTLPGKMGMPQRRSKSKKAQLFGCTNKVAWEVWTDQLEANAHKILPNIATMHFHAISRCSRQVLVSQKQNVGVCKPTVVFNRGMENTSNVDLHLQKWFEPLQLFSKVKF